MTAPDVLLDVLPRWVVVCGKGGVGKTTCAVALAERSARRGERTLIVSTDPAGALPDAIGADDALAASGDPRAAGGGLPLWALQLDAAREREAFLARWRDTLVTVADRGTYLDREEIEGLVDAALPGGDETMGLLRLAALSGDDAWARVVVDTAPTGHTLRLLALPASFRGALALLEAMQEKHRFMVRALTHRYRPDKADAMLRELAESMDRLESLLHDPARLAVVLVTRPEPVVRAESMRLAAALRGMGMRIGATVVNGVTGAAPEDEPARADTGVGDAPSFVVRALAVAPMGLAGAAEWGAAMRAAVPCAESAPRAGSAPGTASEATAGPVAADLLAPSLTVVAGKGGVGKSTLACALGIVAAASGARTLLVSTDPAPSLGDALGVPVGGDVVSVPGLPGLDVWQLDAAAAFERFRAAWGARVDALFDSLAGGALDAAADRRIVRGLLSLAPPGVDEVYALAALGETLAEGRYARIIVDPAPTGHLLRLLEMPALALDWTHRILRLLLRYREVVGLGDAAAELLAFARRTRALAGLLSDPSRAGVVLVALDEPLVRAESGRLALAVGERGIALRAIVWNRVREAHPAPLTAHATAPHFVAAECGRPPVGAAAIAAWASGWRGAETGT